MALDLVEVVLLLIDHDFSVLEVIVKLFFHYSWLF